MSGKNSVDSLRPKLFDTSVKRSVKRKKKTKAVSLSADGLSDTNFGSTSSFRYDNYGVGIKSTQQIPIDWTKFENHTFFNSAEAKINVAFDRIINSYPFDGTKKEIEGFMDSLTGFEKWVFDSFPKNQGFLIFSGSAVNETTGGGTYISIADTPGFAYPTLSDPSDGKSVLDPQKEPFSIELQLFPALQANDNQVICQRLGEQNTKGMMLALSKSTSTTKCNLIFSVTSGSQRAYAQHEIEKGKFNHICATYDNRMDVNKLQLFVSESLVATSSATLEAGTMRFDQKYFTIGSGSTQFINPDGLADIHKFIPQQTFSGAMDEFRFYHSLRGVPQQKRDAKKSIYASKYLALYFKFNEPYGDIGVNKIVLDSSGNSLHANITNFESALRATGSILDYSGAALKNPISYENLDTSPVLFPKYADVIALNEQLLTTGSDYDKKNPNIITRLIPPHYLLQGRDRQGFKTVDGQLSDAFSGGQLPGTGEMGSIQLLTSFLFVWAKYFDELKIFLDHISNIVHVRYDSDGDVVDQFLPFVADYYGFEIPNFFSNATLEQFVGGENIQNPRSGEYTKSKRSLKYVQNQIWRRILVNMGDYVNSKGTVHSVKSIIRATGINPDGLFRIREYGGPIAKRLTGLRQQRTEVSTMIDFSGSLLRTKTPIDAQGFCSTMPYMISPFLSASRVEVGYPHPERFKFATGTIEVINYNQIADGSVFGVTDSNGKEVTFEFDSSGSLSSTGRTMVSLLNWGAGDRDDQLAIRIVQAVTSSFSGSITGSWYQHTASLSQASTKRVSHGNYDISGSVPGLSMKGFGNGRGFIFQGSSYGMHGISTRTTDGLFTSGSWTYESHYMFKEGIKYSATQSLARLCTTGSALSSHFVHTNLLAMSGGAKGVALYARPTTGSYSLDNGYLKLFLTGCDVFDGEKWAISFGRNRGDHSDFLVAPSSSYFLRVARQSFGECKEIYQTSSIYQETRGVITNNMLQSTSSAYNASGSFIVYGSQSLGKVDRFLNDTASIPSAARVTTFEGKTGHIRFWSKALNMNEWKQHVLNFKSLGVDNPRANFNFITHETGSFERLRLDISTDQIVTRSDTSGEIVLHDFSQNHMHLSGKGFEKDKDEVIRPVTFNYSFISPHFDSAQTDNKVRVRGFLDENNFDDDGVAMRAPVTYLPPSNQSGDDVRFSVDFSVIDTLDEDIINLFSSLDFFDNAIGDPNLIFSPVYPDLEQMQKVYFNRLTEKINITSFFEFFKWFDSIFEVLIEQMLPRKTSFMGVNFVIESHLLERNKVRYWFDQSYLLSKQRGNDKGNLLLSQVVGTIKRY